MPAGPEVAFGSYLEWSPIFGGAVLPAAISTIKAAFGWVSHRPIPRFRRGHTLDQHDGARGGGQDGGTTVAGGAGALISPQADPPASALDGIMCSTGAELVTQAERDEASRIMDIGQRQTCCWCSQSSSST
jgi:hypothetical protein